MKCPVCDAGALNGARFCSRCGASMTAIPADRHRGGLGGDLGGTMAKGAVIGAVIALPVPFIGPIAGAVVGAGIAAYKKLSKD
jgi:hypothetical protein